MKSYQEKLTWGDTQSAMNRKRYLKDEKSIAERTKGMSTRDKEYKAAKQEKSSYNPKDLQYPLDPSIKSFSTTEMFYKKNPIKPTKGPKGTNIFYIQI